MTSTKHPQITYDPSGAFLDDAGITRQQLADLYPRLEAARREVLEVDQSIYLSGNPPPAEKDPLDHGFFELPERMLNSYKQHRHSSELGRILKVVHDLRERVDRVVVLGIGGSYMGAKALMEACCDPYFNELSRGDRGSRPRMYFAGNNADNDASQGLLKLLGCGRQAKFLEDRWALVVISKSGRTIETAVSFRQYLAALKSSCGGDPQLLRDLIIPVSGKTGRLADLSKAIGCRECFEVPDGVGGRFSVLSAVGILPATFLGINVVELLEGAVRMNEHFRSAPPEENIVLNYVGVCHLLEAHRNATIRVLSLWAEALETLGLWYDQLLAESLGKQEKGATPLTILNTRDLHSRAQQHQEGRRDKIFTNIIVDRWRCDPLAIGVSEWNQDQLNEFQVRSLPDIMSAAILGTNQAYRESGRPTADIRLPELRESTVGQLLQMLMIATVVEGRLIGINPYGQPGVELYKTNMMRLLREMS
jgi:glucose-6-phosphate isomerase